MGFSKLNIDFKMIAGNMEIFSMENDEELRRVSF